MSELLGEPMSNFWPAILLAIGFPVALLLLNESIAAGARKKWALTSTLRSLRTLVAPCLAIWMFLQHVLEMPHNNIYVQLIKTLFWISVLYSSLGFVNDVVFGSAQKGSWQERLPKLFRDLVRALLVALGAMVIYSQVWGREIEGALTALGVGSIVIGLALQEPLGNIVSGLMLLFERPLNVGDWISVDGVSGKVIEINWRSVHIETPTRELRIVPNVSLYKGAFSNLSRPTPLRTDSIEIGFSYDDAPNRVKDILLDMVASTPGVLADPNPAVRTVNYADFSIIYRLSFSVSRQEDLAATRDRIMTKIWYVARREGLTIPFPIQMEYGPGENPGVANAKPADWLSKQPRFKTAILEEHSSKLPIITDYARGEVIQRPNTHFQGFALVLNGSAALSITDKQGNTIEIGTIGPGEYFGEHGTASLSNEDYGITAINDLKLMIFNTESIGELLNKSPGLAAEVGEAIQARRLAAHEARRHK